MSAALLLRISRFLDVQKGELKKPPPPIEVPTDIATVQFDGSIKMFQCFCNSSLRYEAEYARKKGTTTNTYMLSDGNESVLIDIPRAAYLGPFCAFFACANPDFARSVRSLC